MFFIGRQGGFVPYKLEQGGISRVQRRLPRGWREVGSARAVYERRGYKGSQGDRRERMNECLNVRGVDSTRLGSVAD